MWGYLESFPDGGCEAGQVAGHGPKAPKGQGTLHPAGIPDLKNPV